MRIVIDGRFWAETGPGRYIRNLVKELQNIDHKNEYVILFLKKDHALVTFKDNFSKKEADFRWYTVGEQLKLPRLLNQLNPDLVHFPHFNVPVFYKGKFVVTIHDLIHQHFQMKKVTTRDPLVYKIKSLGYSKVFSKAVNKSINIITPSNFVKDQLLETYKPITKDKVVVTYEGVDEKITSLSKNAKDTDLQKLSKKFSIQKPYLFYVGNVHPHKNVDRLIKVFGKLKDKFTNLQLILSGPETYFYKLLKDTTKVKDVIFTGPITDQELVTLYKNAESYIFPSLEEGFGIPLLEAMACGCPVVSSNAASLPEVGGKACLYFDPQDEIDMINKISQVLTDDKLRKELVRQGDKRYKEFSWKKMAQQTLEVYQQALS